ncbi:MAG: hypothetical protein HUU37_05425 [Bdellovibrionales bacterium]|nr:hypothetical protein [Bdellovibrionales bacterium]
MRLLGLVCLGVFAVGAVAEASKARVASLQGARFLRDPQTIFTNPAHIHDLGEYFTAEFGGTANTDSPKAEGGMLLKKAGGKAGIYLGHMNATQSALRDGEGYFVEENPFEVTYGRGVWGASIHYSRNKKNTTNKGQKTLGARFGVAKTNWEVFTSVDVVGEAAKSASSESKLKYPSVNLGGEYQWGDLYLFTEGTYARSRQDMTSPVAKNGVGVDKKVYEAGVQDLSLSTKGRTFYYGASLKYDVLEKDVYSQYNFTVPVVIGLEQAITDWFKARASLTQNLLLGHTKDTTLTAPSDRKDTVANNTSASAGVAFSWKSFDLDAVVTGSTSGEISGNSLFTRAAATYSF